MDEVLKELVKIYEPDNVDWMGDTISKKNPFTYHHIDEARNGGERSLENGAILTSKSHSYLNYIERIDPGSYKKLNKLFKELNDSKMPPTDEYYKKLFTILKDIEERKNEQTAKRRKKYPVKRRATHGQ